MAIILVFAIAALIGARPWRSQGERWFHESALLVALLLGGLLIALT